MSNPLCHTARQQPPDAAHRPSPPPARHVLSQLFPDAHISCLCLPRGASRSGLAISNNPHSCKPRIASRAFVQSGFNELASLTPAAPSRERDLPEPSRFRFSAVCDSRCWLGWRPASHDPSSFRGSSRACGGVGSGGRELPVGGGTVWCCGLVGCEVVTAAAGNWLGCAWQDGRSPQACA